MAVDVRRFEAGDFERVAALRLEAFRRPSSLAGWRRDGFVLTDGGAVRAIMLATRNGQFFGGRSVPVAFVASVAVDPLARGRGLVRTLFRGALTALRAEGVPLALLYPSSVAAYRRCGFEIAGHHARYRVSTLPLPERATVELEPWSGESPPAGVADCYRRYAAGQPGLLDRSDDWWRERCLSESATAPLYRYLARRDGAVSGYVTYRQAALPGDAYRFRVQVGDLVWHDAETARSLLAVLAAQRPLGVEASWAGPPNEPLALCCDHLERHVDYFLPWMSRLVDPAAALAARGYPPNAETAVSLTVVDPLLDPAERTLRLTVAGGRASVEPAAAPTALRVDAGTLAALFTGWLPPADAARAGRLPDATDAALAALTRLFGGPTPWLIDMA